MKEQSAKAIASSIAAIPTETVAQTMGKGLVLMSLGEKVTPPWRRPAVAFGMLKDLQEQAQAQAQAQGGQYGSWTIIWSTHHKWWVCSLLSCDQPMPGCGGDGPEKSYYADAPYDCVHKAWKSEKGGREWSDG